MNLAQHILLGTIRLYRVTLSPLLTLVTGPGAGCRFHPTCSAYAMEAVQTHGAWRGAWLACRRLGRCHPWGACGFDPVPESSSSSVTPNPPPPQPAPLSAVPVSAR